MLFVGSKPRAVLFDLDGTLVDSAPDLAGAANEMRARRGMLELAQDRYRAYCGSGARGMLWVAFGALPGDPDFAAMRAEFIDLYTSRLTCATFPFEGVVEVLRALEDADFRWGIVTNKAEALARPLCSILGLKPGVLIAGDTTPHLKPHPAPVLAAAAGLAMPPGDCLYVGDDPRDIAAGRAAGMSTAAASWGYLGVDHPIAQWGATYQLQHVREILTLLHLP